MASANENTSRSQWLAMDSGVRNWPTAERGPKLSMAMRQPHKTMTVGVRQDVRQDEVWRGTETVAMVVRSKAANAACWPAWPTDMALIDVFLKRIVVIRFIRQTHGSTWRRVLARGVRRCYLSFARSEDNYPHWEVNGPVCTGNFVPLYAQLEYKPCPKQAASDRIIRKPSWRVARAVRTCCRRSRLFGTSRSQPRPRISMRASPGSFRRSSGRSSRPM